MPELSETIQTADWKKEKHVPAIECPTAVKAGEWFQIKATLGQAIAHPNTTEHHIRWIAVYFQPDGEKAPLEVSNCEFSAHGESAKGPNEGPVYTHHEAITSLKITKPGTLYALAFCNIHGLWQSSRHIELAV